LKTIPCLIDRDVTILQSRQGQEADFGKAFTIACDPYHASFVLGF
jgi:hypothetical protein